MDACMSTARSFFLAFVLLAHLGLGRWPMDAPTAPFLVQPVVRGLYAEDVINMLGVGAGIMRSTSCHLENTEKKAHVVRNSPLLLIDLKVSR
jgi:hypothetical protein